MKHYPYITDRKMTAATAAKFMHDCNIPYLPVVENEQLIGIIDENRARVQSQALIVEDIMDSVPHCINEGASLSRVIRSMLQSKNHYILAVNVEEKIVGIFTTAKALNILLELLDGEESSSSLRIHYDKFPSSLNWRKRG